VTTRERIIRRLFDLDEARLLELERELDALELESRLERQLLLLGEATSRRPEPEGRRVAERGGGPPGSHEPDDRIELAPAALAMG
jgi:hypothetical protein